MTPIPLIPIAATGRCAPLSEQAINLAMIAGLLVVAGFLVGAGIAGYPALAADEDNYLEQAWALNHEGLCDSTSWYARLPVGWIELWFTVNLVGSVISQPSAAGQGPTLWLILTSALLLGWLAGGPRRRLDSLAAAVILKRDAAKSIGWIASCGLVRGYHQCNSEAVSLSAAP